MQFLPTDALSRNFRASPKVFLRFYEDFEELKMNFRALREDCVKSNEKPPPPPPFSRLFIRD
jgi:hypothetical protein